MYFNRFRFNCRLFGESSFPRSLLIFFLVCRTFSCKWQGTCLARPGCVEKVSEHPSKIHLNGLTPMCDSKCFVNQLSEQLGLLKTLQSCHKQTKTSQFFIGSTCCSWAWLANCVTSQAVKSQSIHLHGTPSDFLSVSFNLGIRWEWPN